MANLKDKNLEKTIYTEYEKDELLKRSYIILPKTLWDDVIKYSTDKELGDLIRGIFSYELTFSEPLFSDSTNERIFRIERKGVDLENKNWVMNNDKESTNKVRSGKNYTNWRKAVLERDNYKCVKCGAIDSLQTHHIKQLSKYPELATDINNGITLCYKCHKKEHSKSI